MEPMNDLRTRRRASARLSAAAIVLAALSSCASAPAGSGATAPSSGAAATAAASAGPAPTQTARSGSPEVSAPDKGAAQVKASSQGAAKQATQVAPQAAAGTGPATPAATQPPAKAVEKPAAKAAAKSSGAAAKAAKASAAATAAAAPVEMDGYFKESMADYRSQTLPNGAVLAIKRRAGPAAAAASIVLAGEWRDDPAAAGFGYLALAAAARSVEAAGGKVVLGDGEDDGFLSARLSCPSDRMAEALGLLAGALASGSIPEDAFEAALAEARIAERRDSGDHALRLRSELAAARRGPGASGAPLRGTAASLGAATRESVGRYWSLRSPSARLCVAVVGDFDPAAMAASLGPSLGALPFGAGTAAVAAARGGADQGKSPEAPWFEAMPDQSLAGQALVRGEFPVPSPSSPDYPALLVAAAARDDLVRDALGGSRATILSGAGLDASLTLRVASAPAAAKAAADASAAELAAGRCLDLASGGGRRGAIADSLGAYKARALAACYGASASSEGMAASIAADLASGGDGAAIFRMSSRIKAVKADDVARVSRRYLLEGAWAAVGDPALVSDLRPEDFAGKPQAKP